MDKNPLIADDFYRFQFLSIGYSGVYQYPELHWRYFERAVDLNCEKLGAYKPGQHQPSEQGFNRPGFKDWND